MSPFYADSPFTIPDEAVAVTVDSSSTISSGGTLDWHGRSSIKRRADDVLVLVYRRGTHHAVNDGALYIRFSDDNGATWTAENTALASDGGAAVTGFPMNPSTLAAGQDAGEPWLMNAPNGDLLLHMWRIDYSVDQDGTWQSRSTDGGLTWSTSEGPIQWGGLTAGQSGNTMATDDDFIVGSTLYCGARVLNDPPGDKQAVVFCSSTDNGETWTRLSTLVSQLDLGGVGTQEVGLEYLGSSRVIAIIRDTATITHTYKMVSTNLGVDEAGWGSLLDVTSDFGVSGRHRVYTRAHLKGQANWWNDPVLLAVGFVHGTPGSSTPRQNAVWISRDRGSTWDGPNYIDSSTEDAGYGDMFYDADNDQWVVVINQGTQATCSLNQYRLTIDGI